MAKKKVGKKKAFKRIPFGKDQGFGDFGYSSCPDCGVVVGKLHDTYCDFEECPICHKQLLSCGHAEMVWGPKERGFGKHETRLLNIPKGFR